jgi:hypothetical protein
MIALFAQMGDSGLVFLAMSVILPFHVLAVVKLDPFFNLAPIWGVSQLALLVLGDGLAIRYLAQKP